MKSVSPYRKRSWKASTLPFRVVLFAIQLAVLFTINHFGTSDAQYTDPAWTCPDNQTYTEFYSDRGFVVECQSSDQRCSSYILLPAENLWSPAVRGFLYFIALIWFFLGIAIGADVFMASIEVITSETREVYDNSSGRAIKVTEKIWNPTVANLTLLALGSSAPEILLATIETVSTLNSQPGELGPASIVGSGAFNLFVISAVAVMAIPEGSIKKVEQYGVFCWTAFTSVFGYLWMYIVLSVITPNEITLWEAAVTFGCFPVLVVVAYFLDIQGTQSYTRQDEAIELQETIVALELASGGGELSANRKRIKKEAINVRKQWKQTYKREPTTEEFLKELQNRVLADLSRPPRSEMIYRSNAIRALTGKRRVLPVKESAPRAHPDLGLDAEEHHNPHGVIAFQIKKYEVLESIGQVNLQILRLHGAEGEITVDFMTEDGTAISREDYLATQGTLTMLDGQTTATIPITIIDDNQYEPDENFFVSLTNPTGGATLSPSRSRAEIVILNDDNPGVLSFKPSEYRVSENADFVEVTVHRADGCDGEVTVNYATQPGTAKPSVEGQPGDYEHVEGVLKFEHNQVSQVIRIKIIPDDVVEGDHFFKVLLSNPQGGALLSARVATVVINDMTKSGVFDKLKGVLKTKAAHVSLATSSWREQFEEAIQMGSDFDEEGNKFEPTAMDYVLHFLSFLWKVIFACVPPTSYYGAFPAFFVSLFFVGVQTALVGELATLFGCTIGLKDVVTALTFVSLGTSLPDTFASKNAAESDETADNSIGNITGSNSVNIFLGLGLPWMIGAVYHTIKGDSFSVPAGPLSFSVATFLVCAVICLTVLSLKRLDAFGGGELGGPKWIRYGSATFFIFLWFLFILLCSLNSYGDI